MSKIKIGTQLEEKTYRQLKHAAVRERRPIGDVVQDAVTAYLHRRRKSSLSPVLDREPFKVDDKTHREIMEADFYDQ